MPSTAARLRRWLAAVAVVLMTALAATGRVGGGRPVIDEWIVNVSTVDDGVLVQELLVVDGGVRGAPAVIRRLSHDLGAPEGRELFFDGTAASGLLPSPLGTSGEFSTQVASAGGQGRRYGWGYSFQPNAMRPGTDFSWRVLIGDRVLDAERVRVRLLGAAFDGLRCSAEGAACRVEERESYTDLIIGDLPAGSVVTIEGTVVAEIAHGPDREREREVGYESIVERQFSLAVGGAALAALGAVAGWLIGMSARTQRDRRDEDRRERPYRGLPPLPAVHQPWHAAAARGSESEQADVVTAWFATMTATGVFQPGSHRWTWVKGPAFGSLPAHLAKRIDTRLIDGEVVPGLTHPGGSRLWAVLRRELMHSIRDLRWWSLWRGRSGVRNALAVTACVGVMATTLAFALRSLWSSDWLVGAGLVFGVPMAVAAIAVAWIRPDESPELVLLRRELDDLRAALASGGPEAVEAAATDGTAAQLSAWALAVGAGTQWDAAIRASTLSAEQQRAVAAPLLPRAV